MDRRTLLGRVSGVVLVGLAGCSGDGDGTANPTDTDGGSMATPTPSSTGTETTTGTPTATGTDSSTATPMETDGETPTPTDAGTATATPTPTATPTATPTDTAAADQVVDVAPGGSFSFAPASFTASTGSTVMWRWQAGGHNVRPESIPDGSSWTGTEGGDSTTYGSGHTHSHEFAVAGEYEYYCAPHRGFGMTGSFTVE